MEQESPEHRACRTRTPEEDRAVRAAILSRNLRNLGRIFSGAFTVTPIPAQQHAARPCGCGQCKCGDDA
jgi:hypothetical protein